MTQTMDYARLVQAYKSTTKPDENEGARTYLDQVICFEK